MLYGPFSEDTDFPLRAARPSSGEQPGALRCRAGTWNETGRKPFSFFTLNTAASGVHTKKETSSSPESRKLNKLTAWGPPQSKYFLRDFFHPLKFSLLGFSFLIFKRVIIVFFKKKKITSLS